MRCLRIYRYLCSSSIYIKKGHARIGYAHAMKGDMSDFHQHSILHYIYYAKYGLDRILPFSLDGKRVFII